MLNRSNFEMLRNLSITTIDSLNLMVNLMERQNDKKDLLNIIAQLKKLILEISKRESLK